MTQTAAIPNLTWRWTSELRASPRTRRVWGSRAMTCFWRLLAKRAHLTTELPPIDATWHEVCSVPLVREELSAAIALANEARTLGELGRHDEEIMIYDRLASLFGNASEPALREQVAIALVNKGIRFGQLGRLEDEIEAYDQVIARFGNASEPALREQVAMALRYKGITSSNLGRLEDEIQACEEVIARLGTPPSLRCASRSPWLW